MKKRFLVIAALACALGIHAADVMHMDSDDIAKQEAWLVFNGTMELGEPGQPAPGYCTVEYANRREGYGNPERLYSPLIRRDESGNQYLEMPGYRGIPEYNLYPTSFFLPQDGEVEVSFKAKSIPDEDGLEHDNQPALIMDFRCFDHSREYGSVQERYPVLEGRTFKPGKEWQDYSYRIPARGNFPYAMMFRAFSGNPAENVNGLCLDDVKVRYVGSVEVVHDEVVIDCGRTPRVFYPEETVELRLQALLHGAEDSVTIRLHLRSDYFLENTETLAVTLSKGASAQSGDPRSPYAGSIQYRPKRHGSFNIVAMFDDKPVFSYGGDFATLHKLDPTISPLRRRLGGHFRVNGGSYQLTPSNEWPVIIKQEIALETQLYALCGFGHGMCAFDLKKVQPQHDEMDFSVVDAEMALLEKYGIEPIPSLGAWWIYTGRKNNDGVQVGHMPDWFFDDQFTRPSLESKTPDREPRTLRDDVWRFHVKSAVDHFGGRVGTWMLLVEPQWVLTPEDYLSLQKSAREIIKASKPQDVLIAGDATGDYGYNLVGWIEKLHGLGFENYLDCVSFNPYGSSLDNINGALFRYSNLMAALRSVVDPGTPLWEQELYYIANSKRKQYPNQQSVFSAGDVQRHYLLGLLNGLRGITGISSFTLGKAKDELGTNDVLAGLNSLSFFLDGKSEVIPLDLANKLLRCGIFADESGKRCSGTLWSLRASGMSMVAPAVAGITLYDGYGNERQAQEEIGLGLDPIFATGTKEALTEWFTKAEFVTDQPIALRGRTFGDTTFLEAENLSGASSVVLADFARGIPPVRFCFKDSDFLRLDVDRKLAETGFKAGFDERRMQGGDIAWKTNRAEYTIPDGEAAAMTLTMSDGATLAIWGDADNLWIRAEVADAMVTPSTDDNLYNGDAVELFIDRTPFRRLDVDEFGQKKIPELRIAQYVFAAIPSLTGRSIQVMDASTGGTMASGATLRQERTPSGYALLISLPLKEVTPVPGSRGIIGMNVELSKKDDAESRPKAALLDPDIPSYRFRSHYPLFATKALNANLLNQAGRGIAWKSFQDAVLATTTTHEVSDAMGRGPGIKIDILEEPAWGPTFRRGSITGPPIDVSPGTYLLVFHAKGDRLEHMKVAMGEEKEKKVFSGMDLPVNDRWTKYEIPFSVTQGNPAASVYLEFLASRQASGTAVISDIALYRQDDSRAP